MTPREKEILDLIKENPLVAQNEIARKLSIARASVGVHISNLAKKGYIRGKGYIVNEKHPITLIGCSCMDIFAKGNDVELNQLGEGVFSMSLGGLARNVSERLSLCGADVRLISAVGIDAFGEKIIKNALKHNINIQDIHEVASEKTSTITHLIDQRRKWTTSLADRSVMKFMDVNFFTNRILRIDNSKITFIEGTLAEASIDYLISALKKTLIVYDPCNEKGMLKIDDILEKITLLSIDAQLLGKYLGEDLETQDSLEKAADKMLVRGLPAIVIIDNKLDVFYADAKVRFTYIRGEKERNLCRNKDMLLSAILHAMEENGDIEKSITRFAKKDIRSRV